MCNILPSSSNQQVPGMAPSFLLPPETGGIGPQTTQPAAIQQGAQSSASYELVNRSLLSILGKANEQKSFSSAVGLVDRGVDDSLRAAICNDEYVNFGDLTIPMQPPSAKGSRKTRSIYTFDQWQKAFNIFVTIYATKFPGSLSALMEYGNIINDLYLRNPTTYSWRQYDEMFRYRRQSDRRSFGNVDQTLWLQVATPSSAYKNKTFPGYSMPMSSGTQSKPNDAFAKCLRDNVCYKFQIQRCFFSQCKYKHICRECKGEHPFNKCSSFKKDYNTGKSN